MAEAISEDLVKKIVLGMHKEGMVKTWMKDRPEGWVLADQITWSPFYLNIRQLSSAEPELYAAAVEAMGLLLEKEGFIADGNTKSIGVAMGGISLADGIALTKGIPALYTRKLPEEIKAPEDVERYLAGHGQKALVEGEFNPDNKLCIVDDLVTTLSSKLLAKAQAEGEAARRKFGKRIKLKHVFVLVDREQGAAQKAAEQGLELHSVFGFVTHALPILKDEGKLSAKEYEVISDYLKNKEKYQDKNVQAELTALAKKG